MLIRITKMVTGIVVALSISLGIVVGLAACGDAGTSTGGANPAVEVQTSPSVTPEKSAVEPTEAAPDGWTTFVSEADGFSVDMPGEPQTSTQSMDSALGELTFQFFQVTEGTALYMVTYNDYPIEMTEDDLDPESVLQEGIDATAQGGEAENVRRIDVQGNPAIEGEINLQEKTHIWYRSILVNKRLYQMVMTAPESDKSEFADEVGRFLESFKLLNQ
jgi:hypothetical protein